MLALVGAGARFGLGGLVAGVGRGVAGAVIGGVTGIIVANKVLSGGSFGRF